jgi:Bacterial Ig-like domain
MHGPRRPPYEHGGRVAALRPGEAGEGRHGDVRDGSMYGSHERDGRRSRIDGCDRKGRRRTLSDVAGGVRAVDEVSLYPRSLPQARMAAHFDKATVGDRTPPSIALTRPANGATVPDATPTFSGTAGTATGDSHEIMVKIYPGSTATGSPTATATATRDAVGGWAVDVSSKLPAGTYTARAQQADAGGNVGLSVATTFSVAPSPPPSPDTDPVVLAAGDIADCFSQGDEATASLLDLFPSASVLTVGDNAYEYGTPEEFAECYDPTWGARRAGRVRSRATTSI